MDFLSDPTQLQTPQRNRYQLQEPLSIQNGQFNPNSSIATNEFDSPKNEQLTSNSKRMMLLEFSPKQEPQNRHRNIVFSCEDENSYYKNDAEMQQNSYEYQQTACKSVQKKQVYPQNSSSNRKMSYDDEVYNQQSPLESSKKGRTIERQEQEDLQQLNALDQQLNDMNIHTTSKKPKVDNNSGQAYNQNQDNQQLWRNLQFMQDQEDASMTPYNNMSTQENQNAYTLQNVQSSSIQEHRYPDYSEQEKAIEYQKVIQHFRKITKNSYGAFQNFNKVCDMSNFAKIQTHKFKFLLTNSIS